MVCYDRQGNRNRTQLLRIQTERKEEKERCRSIDAQFAVDLWFSGHIL